MDPGRPYEGILFILGPLSPSPERPYEGILFILGPPSLSPKRPYEGILFILSPPRKGFFMWELLFVKEAALQEGLGFKGLGLGLYSSNVLS